MPYQKDGKRNYEKSTLYTTPGQNNGLTALNEASLESRVMRLEERIREMEKTLTMLNHLAKAVAPLGQIRASSKKGLTDPFQEIRMGL